MKKQNTRTARILALARTGNYTARQIADLTGFDVRFVSSRCSAYGVKLKRATPSYILAPKVSNKGVMTITRRRGTRWEWLSPKAAVPPCALRAAGFDKLRRVSWKVERGRIVIEGLVMNDAN